MQYSAWLTLFGHVYAAAGNKREVIGVLRIGPRIDLRSISDRYARTPRFVRFAARETYDRYLRANRVEHGVESYDEVCTAHPGIDLRSGRQSAVALRLRRAACTMAGRGQACTSLAGRSGLSVVYLTVSGRVELVNISGRERH